MKYIIEVEVEEGDADVQERAHRNFPDDEPDKALENLLMKELQGCLALGHFSAVPLRLTRNQRE
jgi:hypothetical protein